MADAERGPRGHWFGDDLALYLDDCRSVLAVLGDGSVDAVVTDPPYDLTSGKKGGTGGASLNLSHPGGRSRITTGGGFMGQEWDSTGVAFDPAVWRECLRVLRPGGYLIAFGGTRTYHRMVCGIEDAGFEIRDSLHWLYGSGFPKSLDVSKAIDKAAGAEREVVGPKMRPDGRSMLDARDGDESRGEGWDRPWRSDPDAVAANGIGTAPATEEAARWEGWGTALKPGHEPIVLARKPISGNVAANVTVYGTGALNIDGCRVPGAWTSWRRSDGSISPKEGHSSPLPMNRDAGRSEEIARNPENPAGRWPPNILFTHSAACEPAGVRKVRTGTASPRSGGFGGGMFGDGEPDNIGGGRANPDGTETVETWNCMPDCPVAELDRQSGISMSRGHTPARRSGIGYHRNGQGTDDTAAEVNHGTGGASRFYPNFRYQAKAGRKERPIAWLPDCGCTAAEAGLITVPGLPAWSASARDCMACGKPWRKLSHPTVKPLELMRWLVRLVTQPGGIVLDPFAGTGPVLAAARAEGMKVIGTDSWLDAVILAHVRLGTADG
jgi:site-specific DNA-methyltransferase (adenine-specific)